MKLPKAIADFLACVKDLFSGWYRKATIATRTELEQYIDRRMEELLEPEHWERATKDATPCRTDKSFFVVLCGMTISWVSDKSPVLTNRVYLGTCAPDFPAFRPDLQQRYREAFIRTWPDKVPVFSAEPPPSTAAGQIAEMEQARKKAGC